MNVPKNQAQYLTKQYSIDLSNLHIHVDGTVSKLGFPHTYFIEILLNGKLSYVCARVFARIMPSVHEIREDELVSVEGGCCS